MSRLFAHYHAGIIGLLFFFTAFVLIFVYAYRPGKKQEIESHKYIPLNDEGSETEDDR